MDLTAPVQFITDVMQLVAEAVEFTTDTVVVVTAVVYLVFGVLEPGTGTVQFVADMAVATMGGFVLQMVLPLPEAVDIGMEVVVPVVGPGARSERKEAGGNGEGQ